MTPNENTYRVLMDERWDLEDLHTFPHAYGQTYSFIYCFDTELEARKAKRIDEALENYPWNGGYSYVNIYTVLRYQIPVDERPKINSIQYASPGWMELLLNPAVAYKIAKGVGLLLGTGVMAVEAFKRIDKLRLEITRQRRADQVEQIKLASKEAEALNQLSEEVATHLGFSSLEKLNRRTKNPETTLKLLMAHWRRLHVIAEYVRQKKVALPQAPQKKDKK